MTEDERKQLITTLGEDLESSLLSDRGFRAEFCAEFFSGMSVGELVQAAHDAGVECSMSVEEGHLRDERDRLFKVLDACGGRNIEVAEEIERINVQLGESEVEDEDDA